MPENSYGLKFTPKASEDLEQLYSYISEKLFAEVAAGNLLEKIENSIMRLIYYLHSGSFVLDEPLKSRGYRKLIVDNYLAFYCIGSKGTLEARGRSFKQGD